MKLALQVRMTAENVKSLRAEGDDFRWYVKTKCLSCGEVSEQWQYVTREYSYPTTGGRHKANLVLKCKFCHRENSIDIEDDKGAFSGEDSERFQTLATFGCRGVELVDFDPRTGWVVETEAGTIFSDVDLSSREFVEYDEEAKEPVQIFEFQHQFVKVK